jgi:hypothetical protein
MPGYDGWSKKDLIAHLTSIESRQRDQVSCALCGTPWLAEDIDTFNAREVEQRRGWSMEQLRQELEDDSTQLQALIRSMNEADLDRPFDHPRRGRVTVEELVRVIPGHVGRHLEDLTRAG